MTEFHPVPKPPARPKKARLAWNSTLTQSAAPMKRGGYLERTARLKTRKVSKRFARLRCKPFRDWIRTFNCPFNRERMRFDPPESEIGWMLFHKDCSGPIECAHVVSRGAGGADIGNCIPLCRTHHRHQHTLGIDSFQVLYGFDLPKLAARLADRWVTAHPETEGPP